MYTPAKIFNMAVTLFFMFGFRFLPTFASITPVGMAVLGTFIGVIYGYSTCGIIWPSLFAIIAYGSSGYTSMSAAVQSMLGHSTVFQILMGFICVGALSKYGFGKWFVRWSLSRKIFRGKPLFYTWCFMVIFGLSAVIVSQIQLQLLLYVIWVDIALNCGYDRDSDFLYFGMGGILMGTTLGSGMIPYNGWKIGLANTWSGLVGTPLNFGLMGLTTAILTVLIITVYILAMRYVFKVDFSTMQSFDVEKLGDDCKHLTPRTKRVLAVYLLCVVLVIAANTVASSSALAVLINKTLTSGGVFCVCAAILMILPSGEKDGKPCIIFEDIKDKAINWSVIFMCAVTLPITTAVTSDDCGILAWLIDLFTPIFDGKSGMFIVIFTIILSLILTNVGSNIAFGAAMIAIVAPFVVKADLSPQFAGTALLYMVNIGLLLPGASAPAAIFHANDNLGNSKRRMKVVITACLAVMVVSIPYFSILGAIFG